jgi:hypothetical protein
MQCRTVMMALCAAAIGSAIAWNTSPSLRTTASTFVSDYQHTKIQNNPTGIGSRLEYWQKSLEFFADAPLIGHGTGSTEGLFEQAAAGETGVQAEIVNNPHNQTLNVAVQWGAVGVIVLYAMWLAHLSLFRGEGFVTWVGLLVVVQNVLTSLFNSHLFDFVQGWMYVLGVGVAGGMSLAMEGAASPLAPSCWQTLCAAGAAAIQGNSAKQVVVKILAGVTVLVVLCYGILSFVSYSREPADTPLAREAKPILEALGKYRASRGAYPIATIPLVELKENLAREGFLGAESGAISEISREAVYASVNGKSFGLMFHIDRTQDNPSGTECMIQVGRSFLGLSAPPCFR